MAVRIEGELEIRRPGRKKKVESLVQFPKQGEGEWFPLSSVPTLTSRP